MSALFKFLAIILPFFAVLKVIGLLTFLLISIPLLAVVYLFLQFQDADLTVYFYEKFGVQPCAALQDKVVWITGASSGIGEYLAYELCKCGCKIVLSARRADELQRVKDKCSAIGMEKYGKNYDKDNLMILPLDLRKFESHADLTKTVLKHFNRIDVLVNNAGRSQRGWVKDTSLDIEQELLDLNTVGTMSLTKAVLPYMLQANSGQIVVVSSVSGKYGFPYTAAYCASKFALQGYFDSLRMELSDSDIHIQRVCPGPVQSNVAANAFTSIKNKSFKDLLSYTDSGVRMPTERCAYLMAVSMANRLDEVWISTHPMLAYTYMAQYMPTIFQWYSKGNFLSNTKKTFSSH